MKQIVLATKNKGKIKEFSRLLADVEVEILGMDSFPHIVPVEETGATFAENAILKAEQVANETGLIAIADDSGLVVDCLDGAPGVYSARYAGDHGDDKANNLKLLAVMKNIPTDRRQGRFHCAIAISQPGGQTIVVEDVCQGCIAYKEEGDNGFGYDPLFIPDGFKKTMGQMEQDEKNKISHRAKAVAKAVATLKKLID